MLKLSRYYFTLLIATLFFVATNHCAFESLFSEHSSVAAECSSHSKEDPASHSEGNPCTPTFATYQSQIELVPVALVFNDSLLSHLLSVFATPSFNFTSSEFSARQENSLNKLDPLVSLSIASNAPPASA